MESNLAEKRAELRILAFVAAGMQERIRRQLAPLDVTIDFISKVAELSQLTLRQTLYPVALLPAVLPDKQLVGLVGRDCSAGAAPGDPGLRAFGKFSVVGGSSGARRLRRNRKNRLRTRNSNAPFSVPRRVLRSAGSITAGSNDSHSGNCVRLQRRIDVPEDRCCV